MILSKFFSLRASVLGAASAVLFGSFALAPAALAQAQRPAATGPVKTETSTFENWVLTCQEQPPTAGAKVGKKTCWAAMRITDSKSNRVVMVWKIGKDAKEIPTIALTMPTGMLVREGVDLTVGQTTKRLAFQWCNQSECEASIPYDDALARDLTANKEATISFYLQDGRQVSVKVAIGGIDKVLAGLKKV